MGWVVGPLPSPPPGVPHQHMEAEGSLPCGPAHLYKSGSTRFAFVGLLSRVNSSMGFQVGWPVELGSTNVTTIGFLTYSRKRGNKGSHICWRSPQSRVPGSQSHLPFRGHLSFLSFGRCLIEDAGACQFPALAKHTHTTTDCRWPGSRSRLGQRGHNTGGRTGKQGGRFQEAFETAMSLG